MWEEASPQSRQAAPSLAPQPGLLTTAAPGLCLLTRKRERQQGPPWKHPEDSEAVPESLKQAARTVKAAATLCAGLVVRQAGGLS